MPIPPPVTQEKRVLCDLCGKTYKHMRSLSTHIRRHHMSKVFWTQPMCRCWCGVRYYNTASSRRSTIRGPRYMTFELHLKIVLLTETLTEHLLRHALGVED